jgi:hypothetical protein
VRLSRWGTRATPEQMDRYRELGAAPRPALAYDPAPPRPHPAANAWPDNAVTVTYGELRRLVALHLTLCASTMPHDRPWVWMKLRAQAVADGEAPLLLSEVLSPDDLPPG